MALRLLAFFLHDYKWGERIRGDERRFLELLREFNRLNFKLYVVEYGSSQLKSYYEKEAMDNVTTVIIPRSHRFVILQILTYVVAISVKLRGKIDVIYVHNQDLYNIVAFVVARLVTQKPSALVVHFVKDLNSSLKDLYRTYRWSIFDLLLGVLYKLLIKMARK